MYQTEFHHHLADNTLVVVVATCKDILFPNDVTGLTITFFNTEDNIINVEYSLELFEELELLAMDGFTEKYYNNTRMN